MNCAHEIAELAVFPHAVLPVLECEGCHYSVAADIRYGPFTEYARWTCPRADCGVTNLMRKGD